MRHPLPALALAGLLAGGTIAAAAGVASASPRGGRTVVETDSLVPVVAPFLGATNAVRGVPGGGAPWVIDHGHVELSTKGRIELEVEGLVIDPTFANAAVAGTNPAPTWKVIVSCVSTDSAGAVVTANVASAPFPATSTGNAEVRTSVTLPQPCLAPVVFVANGGGNGAWFAVTGA